MTAGIGSEANRPDVRALRRVKGPTHLLLRSYRYAKRCGVRGHTWLGPLRVQRSNAIVPTDRDGAGIAESYTLQGVRGLRKIPDARPDQSPREKGEAPLQGRLAFFFLHLRNSKTHLTVREEAKFFLSMEAVMSFEELVAKLAESFGEQPVPSGEGGLFFVQADFEVFQDGERIVLWSPELDLGHEDWSSPEEAWKVFQAAGGQA